ncbi:cation:proton antiporter [Geodermatophilus sp. YIM 151500]|uniref:cation:proton antiporter domain-containing protein n=1 Tax=Geodermatophilus sp. YIM 151500 TaxID=2984531 RepID=UPI0021E47377|nr:cation:proton antiporter [Geodermatophilus sp. YIM 151500]MCV2489948.1 cation:proton antiporter [Geodermatophilus sp. YIM 151500]
MELLAVFGVVLAVAALLSGLASRTVLSTDRQHLPVGLVRQTARLPGRALVIGMPLTAFGIAALTVLLTDLDWLQALLVGAVLSPTDPVFAAAIVQREETPARRSGPARP